MTASEMRYELLLLLDDFFEYGAPAYDDAQISRFLTKAQWRVFKKRYDLFTNNIGKGFESTEKRRRELEQLIKPAHYDSTDVPGSSITVSSDQTGIHPNGVFFDLPEDFLYAIEESVITSTSTPSEIIVKPIEHDEYLSAKDNPYKKLYEKLAWRMDISKVTQPVGDSAGTAKRTEIITDGSTINYYRLKYLRTLPDIVVDSLDSSNEVHSILDESVHPDIVDAAYVMATAAVKPEEYQVAFNENKNSEN